MEIIISFLVSVVAGVTSYYICKWLDGNNRDNQPKKTPGGDAPGLSLCVPVGTISFLAIAIIAYAAPECNIPKTKIL